MQNLSTSKMASYGFNAGFFLITAGICALMDSVLLENPPPAPPWAKYYKETPNADFGIRMSYDSTKDTTMTVTISYDTETESALNFFRNPQLAGWIDGFTNCKVINWKFQPCTVSKFEQGHLVCASTTQCIFDRVYSCITDAFTEPLSMGKFLICVYTGKTTVECVKEFKLDEEKIKECVTSENGARKCNDFHKSFSDARSIRMQTEATKTGEMPSAITDFKTTTCMVLAQGSLECPSVCTVPP